MRRLRYPLFFMLLSCSIAPLVGQSPESIFKSGTRAEAKGELDAAYDAFKRAHDKKPLDAKYLAAYLKLRASASEKHLENGQTLRDLAKLSEAGAEFRRAAEIDPSNFGALQAVRRTADLIKKRETEQSLPPQARTQLSALGKAAASAAGPVALDLGTNSPLTLHITATTDVLYKTIGKLAGFNVLIDPDYKPQKLSFELKDVTIRDALAMLALQSKTFWRPVSSNTIIVSTDNAGKRKELEQSVMMTFYLHNVATATELQEAAATLKSMLDITRIQTSPEQRSLTLRGTLDQMVLAKRLLQDIDKPRSEVMIEIAVLEVSRGRIRTLGVNPPTSVTATLQPTSISTSTAPASGAGFTLAALAALNANNIQISIPSASLSALMSDSNTKVLQKPQIRAMDSEKATLKIGDRIPIATGSFQSGLNNGVNTQFQYIDVGVNVDIVPYIHSNREVTLKISFEITSVTGEQSVGGITEPTIGQRRIEHQVRLADGEVNLIGGILQNSESHSLSGYPMLTKIPLLKYLFGQENKDRQESEIVFAITPHIVRSSDSSEDSERAVDVGTGTTITYRTIDADIPASTSAKPQTTSPAAQMPSPAAGSPTSGSVN